MPVPALHLNLAPRPSLWRQRHKTLGWIALGAGLVFLVGAIGFTWRAYHQANRAGREAVSLTEETRRAARQEQQIQASLQEMDATREQSRWKLAEKILQERGLPWSRVTAELEQCMVPDMRLKGLQRARSNAQQVVMKIKGEARTREAEAAFVEALRGTPVFAQVVLERESERTGGGWDFEISLPAAPIPPPFKFKPIKVGTPAAAPAKVTTPARPVAVPLRTPAAPLGGTRPQSLAPPPARPPAPSPAARYDVVPAQPGPDGEGSARPNRPRLGRRPINPSGDAQRPE